MNNANNLRASYAAGQRDFRKTNLVGAYLAGADLAEANLTRATLTEANLTRADLAGANLAGADLAGAYLAEADLAEANLTEANLTRANLTGANLTGANLTGAGLAPGLGVTGSFRQFGPVGSRGDYLNVAETNQGLRLKTGCTNWVAVEEFAAAVNQTHGNNEHGQEYRIVLKQIKKDFTS